MATKVAVIGFQAGAGWTGKREMERGKVTRLTLDLVGEPATKGSWKVRGSKLVADNAAAQKSWNAQLGWSFKMLMRGQPPIEREAAVVVEVDYYRKRPRASSYGFPVGDLDKLDRALLDALQGIVYVNDVQVIELRARKFYADALRKPGAAITITRAGILWE